MAANFNGRMWIMGGWYNGRLPDASASNEVWASNDGRSWEQVTPSAPWSARSSAALVAFKGELWLLGGVEDLSGDRKKQKNDVWHSSDGKE